MTGVELTGRVPLGQDIIRQPTTADKDGIDTQIQRGFPTERILRGKSVQYETEIRLVKGRTLMQIDVEAKKLHRANRYFPLKQRQDVELGGKPSHLQHVPARAIFQHQVVHNNTIQQAYIYAPDGQLCLKHLAKLIGHKHRHALLDIGDIQQQYGADVNAQHDTDNPTYCTF